MLLKIYATYQNNIIKLYVKIMINTIKKSLKKVKNILKYNRGEKSIKFRLLFIPTQSLYSKI